MSWRCDVCDGDLTAFVKQGLKKGIQCPSCHRRVDSVRRMYRTRDIEIEGQTFTVKIYRRKMQVAKGYSLEGTTEYKGRLVAQDTLSDENEEKLLFLMKNAIRMRMQSKGPL